MVFGTFDGLHKGHLDFFRQAKNFIQNSFLIVSIARDKNVARIKKRPPLLNEEQRMALVKNCPLVDKVVMSGVRNYLPHILKENPDIIALGYDQKTYVSNLKKDLKNQAKKSKMRMAIKIVRLKPYKEKFYKNHLLKNKR